MSHIVESKHVREVLKFRIQSLRATGYDLIASLIETDLASIMQEELFMTITKQESIFFDRIKSRPEINT